MSETKDIARLLKIGAIEVARSRPSSFPTSRGTYITLPGVTKRFRSPKPMTDKFKSLLFIR